MERTIITTQDGSSSIHIADWEESYHSKHGAIQEAKHVFIKNGLAYFPNQKVAILEIGFGTGLNAFITFLESVNKKQSIDYVGVEAYPVSFEEVSQLNYVAELKAVENRHIFDFLHQSNWDEKLDLTDRFTFTKRKQLFQTICDQSKYDLIYFDAFGYRVQPELWSVAIFESMYKALKSKGILVTYAARGIIKRNMIEAGFTVEKLPGAPGKREMFRAFK